MGSGARLEGDTRRNDERTIGDPLLKHEVVAAVAIAHAQPRRARLWVLIRRQQVDIVRLALRPARVICLQQPV